MWHSRSSAIKVARAQADDSRGARRQKKSESLCTSEDTRATFRCLNELHDGGILDCGESGTTLRFLLPVASALGINAEFIGHGRLPERPMSALTDALRENGAVISADNLPIKVSGQLHPGVFRVPGNISSQFISGLLFALPLLDGYSEIVIEGKRESVGYIDMTLDTLRSFSINIEETPSGYKIKGPQNISSPTPRAFRVTGRTPRSSFAQVRSAERRISRGCHPTADRATARL